MSRQDHGWTTAWATAPQRPGAGFAPNWSAEGFAGHTIRQTVRLSVGADTLRVRLSNRYGTGPLRVAGLTIAAAAGGVIKPDTLQELTAGGKPAFTVPAGADLATDAAQFPVDALESVTVSLYLAEPSGPATYHAQALATTYRAAGDHRADADDTAFTEASQSFYYLGGIEVAAAPGGEADGIVVLGDSLIDGTGSSPDTDQRFPDLLAHRFATVGRPRPVLNLGIGGNRVTVDSAWLGDRATARFQHDVLAQPGVGTVVILAGINDLAISEIAQTSPFPVLAPYIEVSAAQVIAGHREMIQRARGAGLRVVGATLLPMRGSAFSTPRSEAKRDAVNTWIRESGEYDAVVDLALALGDALDPAHDSGDGLHLNDTGYRAMADAVELAAL
ncbi:SGNH/GDSL hydrolase family protein [Frankia sp. CNm7]|uniref:SGNH/GDSL hydrolase family protein n=1 Tax=Frankia nepalensis TaxID=1836974 RepID=A0A937RDD5_9ACTN|nr:SGNH/GDSL hydrolase family protein [Frankia nepalensis]MBL7500808.1 SGNH/GDSL hydrolase family protein [Frankia nepalensis]MBL7512615.1 SGNH/GDSL hydrolase family protein [Frankia nepalensis]MBL7523055.1 SGNH/GDSL hydrolase family protein [Frankia nepalensis]MBL7628192.1 SGNH/GDSL hydrolase family protein [Frankia nepalensis]